MNTGRVTLRTRGKKKAGILQHMAEIRRKVVDLIKKQGTAAKEKFRAVVLENWMKNNDNKECNECLFYPYFLLVMMLCVCCMYMPYIV